jgi:hypothetical protein
MFSSSGEKRGVLILSPGLYGGLYGQNLPYKFKKSYADFRNRNFEKSQSGFKRAGRHSELHETTII